MILYRKNSKRMNKKLLFVILFIIFVNIRCNKIDVINPIIETPIAKPYVYLPKPTKIEIVSDIVKIEPWDNLKLLANVYDSLGNKMANQLIIWKSSDDLVALINQDGVVSCNLIGDVEITASCESISTSFKINVNIKDPFLVSKTILLDSLGDGAETSVSMNPKNPLNLSASANWLNYSSFDGGRTWNKNTFGIDGQAMADPNVFFHSDGTLLRQALSWAPSPRGIVKEMRTKE